MIKQRHPGEIARGFFLLCHPLPVFFHVLAVTLLAVLAGWPEIAWGTLALIVLAHTAMQIAIATLNDYSDRVHDATSRKPKPIPLGLVRPREALIVGVTMILIMIVILLPLNVLALLISLLYLLCGQSYNLWLKKTPFSGIVFALAIPLIPLYAFVGMGHTPLFIFWFVPIAALLGIALNLANSLPDIGEDRENGERTLAVVLGETRSFLLCSLLLLLAMLLIGVLAWTHIVPAQPWILIPTLLTNSLILIGNGLFIDKKSTHPPNWKVFFYVVVLISLLLAGGWLVSILL